jgi:hypothetical protein
MLDTYYIPLVFMHLEVSEQKASHSKRAGLTCQVNLVRHEIGDAHT